jgi:putative ABC transport system ATP-binding protein
VIGAALLVSLHQASETLVPVLIGLVIDRAVVTGDALALARWLGVLAGLFAVLAAAGLAGYYLLERTAQWIAHDARARVVDRVLDARGGVGSRPGDLVRLASDDAEAVSQAVVAVGLGAGAVTALAGGSAVLLATSPTLGAVILGGLPVVVVLVGLLSRPLAARIETEQTAAATTAGIATDLLRGLRPLKGLGAEPAAAVRYRLASRAALAARVRSARFIGAYEGAALTVSGVFLVLVAWVGGSLAVAGDITVGELVAAVGLAQFLIGPLQNAVAVGALVAGVRAAKARIVAVTSAAPAVTDPPARRDDDRAVAGRLRLVAVRSGELAGIDLDVAAGRLLGVVAPPRETADLLALLSRQVDPESGEVRLDHRSVREVPLARLRAAVLVVPHDAVLFAGSVLANVRAGGSADGSVEGPGEGSAAGSVSGASAALSAAGADRLAEEVPGGLETPLPEVGRTLSGGQRQRVALARALAADAPVLVLHDPTSALDAATEGLVAAGLARLRRGRTTVMITDSPALLAAADRVVVLRDGRVAVAGTHAELVAGDAGYREAVLS